MTPVALDALDRAVRIVGDRWSLLILGALLDGDRRYGELHEQIDGISTSMLAQRVAALEAAGLILAEPYSRRPPRMRYALTADGRGLTGALSALTLWGAQLGGGGGGRDGKGDGDGDELELRHDICGTPLELSWRCPTCELEVDLQATSPAATLDHPSSYHA
jgi:DNA-binding HxlR family transcriptional regulator